MNSPRNPASSLTLAIAAALAASVASPAAAQIQVDVNGRAVSFGAVGPQRIDGRVLIPLRAVVEALGAEVEWNPATQTVLGRKGEREFSLPIGSRTATVNRSPVNLDVPAQLIRGNTMVPLRFVAEALGAEVGWNASTQQVAIDNRSGGGPATPAPSGEDRIRGEVVAVTTGQNPTIVIRSEGVRQTYRLNRDTVVSRGEEGQRGTDAELSQVRAGDSVRLRVNADRGTADRIEVFTAAGEDRNPRNPRTPRNGDGGVFGEVVAVRSRGQRSTLTVQTRTGREAFELSSAVEISRTVGRQGSQRAAFADLRVGDRVRLSQNADGVVTSVYARAASGNAPGSAPTRSLVTGELAAVRPNTNPPSVIVLVGGRRVTLEVTRETDIYRASAPGRNPSRAQLDDLQPGDDVRIRTDATGLVAQEIDVEVAR
jgi:hypothetical protein